MWLMLLSISVVVGFIPIMRHEVARRRFVEGWMTSIRHLPDGGRVHVLDSKLRGACGMAILGNSGGVLTIAFVVHTGASTRGVEGVSTLTFLTDKKAHISGPAIAEAENGVVSLIYKNDATTPILLRALANSSRRFRVWARSPAWRGEKTMLFESAELRGPALALLADVEAGRLAWKKVMESEELFPSDPQKRTIN